MQPRLQGLRSSRGTDFIDLVCPDLLVDKEEDFQVHPYRILLDLDGTVAQNAGRRVAARHFGISLSEEQHGRLPDLLGLTDEQFWAWWHENQEEIYDQADPLPGAAAVIRRLREAGSFVAVVTARRSSAEAVTAYWLARHGFACDQMVFDADDKQSIARALELTLAFEDDVENAVRLADLMPVALMETVRNRGAAVDHPQIYRASGWDQVLPWLGRLAARPA